MFCCKILILPVLIKKYNFAPATIEFPSKQLSVETNLFGTGNPSIQTRKLKQIKVNRKGKVDWRSNRFIYMKKKYIGQHRI